MQNLSAVCNEHKHKLVCVHSDMTAITAHASLISADVDILT